MNKKTFFFTSIFVAMLAGGCTTKIEIKAHEINSAQSRIDTEAHYQIRTGRRWEFEYAQFGYPSNPSELYDNREFDQGVCAAIAKILSDGALRIGGDRACNRELIAVDNNALKQAGLAMPPWPWKEINEMVDAQLWNSTRSIAEENPKIFEFTMLGDARLLDNSLTAVWVDTCSLSKRDRLNGVESSRSPNVTIRSTSNPTDQMLLNSGYPILFKDILFTADIRQHENGRAFVDVSRLRVSHQQQAVGPESTALSSTPVCIVSQKSD